MQEICRAAPASRRFFRRGGDGRGTALDHHDDLLPQAQFAGVYYAKEAGIFEKYGLSVEIRHKTAELSIIDYLTQKRSEFIVAPLATALLAGRRRFRWSTSARSARAAPSCWSPAGKTASGKRKT